MPGKEPSLELQSARSLYFLKERATREPLCLCLSFHPIARSPLCYKQDMENKGPCLKVLWMWVKRKKEPTLVNYIASGNCLCPLLKRRKDRLHKMIK